MRADVWTEDAKGRQIVATRAELTAHTAAVASHQSAALILGLPTPGFGRWEDQPVSVTLPPTGDSASTATAVHHAALSRPRRCSATRRDTSSPRRRVQPWTSPPTFPLPEALVLLDSAARLICASLVNHVRRRDYYDNADAYVLERNANRRCATWGTGSCGGWPRRPCSHRPSSWKESRTHWPGDR